MAIASQPAARGNRILERLAPRERERVGALAERVALVPAERVCQAGAVARHVFFPHEGVISLFGSASGGPEVGVGIVGAAGMVGLSVAAGQPRSALSAASQGHGSADRLEAGAFAGLLAQHSGLRAAMLGYACERAAQMARNTACLSTHPAQRRLARWMLDVTPGTTGGHFASTQAETAQALGVQRPAVNRAAGALQQAGLIRYQRGQVSILDRPGLAAVACDCSSPLLPTRRPRPR